MPFKLREFGDFGTDDSVARGLVTAVASGSVFGGPVGALLGLGVGLMNRAFRKSELAYQAQEAEAVAGLQDLAGAMIGEAQGMVRTEEDQSRVDLMQANLAALQQASMHPDPAIRQAAAAQLQDYAAVVQGSLDAMTTRNDAFMNRELGMLDNLATREIENYQTALGGARAAQSVAEQAHQLLSDPEFDPNNPLNRGQLAQLLGQSTRSLVIDPQDMADVLAQSGMGVPLISGYLQYQAGKMDAADFNWSKEDWRKVFSATLVAARNQSQAAVEQAQQRALQLDSAAQRLGYQPAISYRDQIISGRVQPSAAVPGTPGAYVEPPSGPEMDERLKGTPAGWAESLVRGITRGDQQGNPDPYGWWSRLFGGEQAQPQPQPQQQPPSMPFPIRGRVDRRVNR